MNNSPDKDNAVSSEIGTAENTEEKKNETEPAGNGTDKKENKNQKPKKVKMQITGNKRRKKIIKTVIWALVIVILALFVCRHLAFKGNTVAAGIWNNTAGILNDGWKISADGGEDSTYKVYTVSRRTVQKVLSGTGTLMPYDEYTVSALTAGEIVEDNFEEGDVVEEDFVMMRIDSSDLDSGLTDARDAYDDAVERLEDLRESLDDLNITSDYAGVVQVMNYEKGDDIRAGDVIANIVDREIMLIDIPFLQSDALSIRKGDKAVLVAGDNLEELDGTVDEISPVHSTNATGAVIVKVTIAVKNPGAITEAVTATAKVGDYYGTDASNFYYNVNEYVIAEVSGEIAEIVKEEGDYVTEGDIILVLDDEDINDSIEDAERAVNKAADRLEDAEENYENYDITAPISGTVVEKNFKKGEKISGGNTGNNTVAVIYDLSALKFEMNIDELDIDSLAVGQEVTVTSDAKTGMSYTGEITKISVQGVTSNGTTSYPITVILKDYGQESGNALRPGMNIDAEIIIEKRENVLAIPLDAVGRGNKVKVIKNTESKKASAEKEEAVQTEDIKTPEQAMPEGMQMPEGARPEGKVSGGYKTVPKTTKYEEIRVETGISDDDYVEVISGLEEGDMVIVETATAPTSQNQFGMMGGMGGGMSMGGMGGMSSAGMGGGPSMGGNRGGNFPGGR